MTTSQTYIEGLHDFNIPHHMRDGITRYIEHGHAVGHFLTALLSNDLMQAFSRADHDNGYAMKRWAEYLYNCAPLECYGSPEKVKAWQAKGGMGGNNASVG